jgi:hypothetical protein
MTGKRIAMVVFVAPLLVGCRTETHPAETVATSVRPTVAATAPIAASGTPTASANAVAPPPSASAAAPAGSEWSFDADPIDAPPGGFSFGRTGSGKPGRWAVRSDGDAPSKPNVLAQLDADPTDDRFPIAVVEAASFRDLALSVRCKQMAGSVDQACGLVFRYRDENNYYLTRANALEGNVRLYCVKDGKRQQIATWSGSVASKVWHEYRVEARGSRFQISWDGKNVLDHEDKTFTEAGKVGVWTKADSVTYFDDLKASPL